MLFGFVVILLLAFTNNKHGADSLSGEAFDLLSSLGDFLEFKDTMVAQKSMKTESSAKISTTSAKPTSQSKRSEGMLDLCVSGHHV